MDHESFDRCPKMNPYSARGLVAPAVTYSNADSPTGVRRVGQFGATDMCAVAGIGEFAVARRYGDRIRPFFLFWGQLIGLQRGETDGILGAALRRHREECYKASSRQ